MDWFDELQEKQLAAYDRKWPAKGTWLRELDAVYLYGTLGSEAVLLRDRRVWIWVDFQSAKVSEVGRIATNEERVAALVLGGEHHWVLRTLLPQRPFSARGCARCDGSGRVLMRVICPDCSGPGWLPPAT